MGVKRYAKFSYNDEALAIYSSDARQLLQNGVSSGREFWLRGIAITNSHASEGVVVNLYDSNTEGASPTATLQRAALYVAAANTAVFSFEGPGIKFATGILAGLATATGTISAYSVTVWGYES